MPLMLPFLPAHRRTLPLSAVLALLAAASLASLTLTTAACAQNTVVQRRGFTPPPTLLKYLNTLNYDTTEYVPLIVVNPGQWFQPESPLPATPIALETLAQAAHLRVVATGSLNTLVPPTVARITAKPGKPNLFAGMRRDELVKALTGSLTEAQWRIIGSADGIGVGDLNEDQKALWAEIVPDHIYVQKSTLEPGDTPGSWKYADTTRTQVDDTATVRIRVSKQVSYMLSKKGTDDYNYGGSPYFNDQAAGQTKLMVSMPSATASRERKSAYGVALLTDVANTDKVSDVDYASPSLDPRIRLHFDPKPAPSTTPLPTANGAPPQASNPTDDDGLSLLPTVGDLIERINGATHLSFAADRRVRDLPIYLRGTSARSGDLLHALTRSVGGTFRALPASAPGEPTIYLLTCDREGIGAQIGRLNEWGEEAYVEKYDAQRNADERTAKQNPLAGLSFAPGDKFAPTRQQVKTAEAEWQRAKYAAAPEVKWEDLSPSLQEGVRNSAESVLRTGTSLRTDRIRLGEELTAYLVVPGIGAIEDDALGRSIGHQYLEEIAFDPALAPPKAKPAPAEPEAAKPFAWPAKLTRRVLVAAPTSAEEARSLARAAHTRGFTDLWLQVSLADPAAAAKLLEAGVRAGAAEHIAVGATVALLNRGGLPGEPDRNILGETGAAYAARRIATEHYPDAVADPRFKAYIDRSFGRYAGWIAPPDAEAILPRIAPLAAVPGLSSLTLRDTAGPGWTEATRVGDGIRTDGHLGYTLAMRRAFLADYGIDPIDIPDMGYSLSSVSWNLGLFSSDDAQYRFVNGQMEPRPSREVPGLAWASYRAQSNRKMMGVLYAALRKAHPALALFLDDRLTPYDQPDHSWFGSWDAADRFPVNLPSAVDSEVRASARSHSKTLIAFWGEWWMRSVGTADDTPANFAKRLAVAAAANTPPAWDGVALDLPALPVPSLLRLLTGLPPVGTDAPR